MSALAWFMGGIFLGLLVMAVMQFVDWLFTPLTVAMHALFAMDAAERQREVDRRRDLQRYSDAMRAFKRGEEQQR